MSASETSFSNHNFTLIVKLRITGDELKLTLIRSPGVQSFFSGHYIDGVRKTVFTLTDFMKAKDGPLSDDYNAVRQTLPNNLTCITEEVMSKTEAEANKYIDAYNELNQPRTLLPQP
ncbi:MAG: hypothetical protein COV52_03725 [Gammaproteobacteria bacterium CG11_big_fil_rev_8_21_14_0_20_46_22]|nr:MAG: hypothetical protein COW05_04545 [Gammaproteobacteria bacterium CG12_big_fil_rev_8_21_14_0_65_46_12]PIR11429.1 MAG: hypothetical protein COV52_03725 [Gammaproteobacteria bacterium CG11_big_fil_rev_8_21_14_0_20_46_22]